MRGKYERLRDARLSHDRRIICPAATSVTEAAFSGVRRHRPDYSNLFGFITDFPAGVAVPREGIGTCMYCCRPIETYVNAGYVRGMSWREVRLTIREEPW